LQALADLDRGDPKFAFQAARSMGLYRRLWVSCVPEHPEGVITEANHRTSKEATTDLSNERDGLQHRPDRQLSRLYTFEQALEQTHERLTGVLKDWNQCSKSNLAVLMNIKRDA
jgi:hypothetical protein